MRKDLEESGRAKRRKVPEGQSGVRGVTWLPKKRKWLARLQEVFNGTKYDVQFASAAVAENLGGVRAGDKAEGRRTTERRARSDWATKEKEMAC